MAFTVEDGTGVAGANGYITEDYFDSYCEDRGITPADGDTEAAIVRGTASLDGLYGSRYPGTRTNGRSQGLEFPRTGATDAAGEDIADDEIPVEIMNATCELAIREKAEPGSTAPDLDRGGSIKRLKAGSVEIEYGANASATTTFSIIDGILAPLIGNKPSGLFAMAVRG